MDVREGVVQSEGTILVTESGDVGTNEILKVYNVFKNGPKPSSFCLFSFFSQYKDK